jgi:hypothetical protein
MKKVGGSAGLAAMIKQRSELVQQAQLSGQDPTVPPIIMQSQQATPQSSSQTAPKPPVSTYQPTTTTFSPANKCYVCDKTVYKTEEIVAVGKVWHDKCFTCGGKNNDGCGRTMKRDGYLDHDSQPYCQACFNKLFRTKGFGYGNSLNTDYGANLASKSTDSNSSDTKPIVTQQALTKSAPPVPPAMPFKAPPAPPSAPPAPPAVPAPVAPPAAPAPVAPPAVPAPVAPPAAPAPVAPPAVPAPVAPPAPLASRPTAPQTPSIPSEPLKQAAPVSPKPPTSNAASTTVPAKYTPTNNVTVSTNSAPKCTSCAKTVYKMEEIIAVGRVWHNSCFVCGGTKGDGCKRSLTRDNYVDHENHPYCNPCYSKLFRPKGFGYGNTLSTDYGPTPETIAANSFVVQAVGKASTDSFCKPKPPGRPGAPPAPPLALPSAPPSTLTAGVRIPVVDPAEVRRGSTLAIGKGAGQLYQEATYQGDNDEVDDSEW